MADRGWLSGPWAPARRPLRRRRLRRGGHQPHAAGTSSLTRAADPARPQGSWPAGRGPHTSSRGASAGFELVPWHVHQRDVPRLRLPCLPQYAGSVPLHYFEAAQQRERRTPAGRPARPSLYASQSVPPGPSESVGRALHPVLTLDTRLLLTVPGLHTAAEHVVLQVRRSAAANLGVPKQIY